MGRPLKMVDRLTPELRTRDFPLNLRTPSDRARRTRKKGPGLAGGGARRDARAGKGWGGERDGRCGT